MISDYKTSCRPTPNQTRTYIIIGVQTNSLHGNHKKKADAFISFKIFGIRSFDSVLSFSSLEAAGQCILKRKVFFLFLTGLNWNWIGLE